MSKSVLHDYKLSQYCPNNSGYANEENISNVVTNPSHQWMELGRVKICDWWA